MNNTKYNPMNEYGCFLQSGDCESRKVQINKKKKKLFQYKPPASPCELKTNEPCLHLRFKSEQINRDCLTKEEYFDMLATPKRHPWLEEKDGRSPNKKKKKTRKIVAPKEKPKMTQEAGDFANDFEEDMWDIMSPEITDRLISFLVNEFGMAEVEAEYFIDSKSRVKKKAVNSYKQKESNILFEIGPKDKWVKEFSNVFSKRIEQYIISILLTRRTPRLKKLAERILEQLCDLAEEKTTLQHPKTKIEKTLVLIANCLAIFVEGLLKETNIIDEKTIYTLTEVEVSAGPHEGKGDKSNKDKSGKEKKQKEESKSKEDVSKDKVKPEKDEKSKKETKKYEKDSKKEDEKDNKKQDEKENKKQDDKDNKKQDEKDYKKQDEKNNKKQDEKDYKKQDEKDNKKQDEKDNKKQDEETKKQDEEETKMKDDQTTKDKKNSKSEVNDDGKTNEDKAKAMDEFEEKDESNKKSMDDEKTEDKEDKSDSKDTVKEKIDWD